MTGPGKEDASCGIESDTPEMKVERLIRTRCVIADIRQIAECDSRTQFAVWAFVELVPDHFAIRECLGVIRAGNTDRVAPGPKRSPRKGQPTKSRLASNERRTSMMIRQSMTAAAMLLEWVVNLYRIIPHESVRTRCKTMRTTKNSFYIMHICAEKSKRSNSARVKVVRIFLRDIGRGHD